MFGAAVGFPAAARPHKPALGGDADVRTVAGPRRQRAGDQALVVAALGLVPAVGIGSVEKTDASIKRCVKHRESACLVAIAISGQSHAAETGSGHLQHPMY